MKKLNEIRAGNEGKTGIEDRDRGKDEEEDKARVEDKTEVKVSVQHSKRGTRSVNHQTLATKYNVPEDVILNLVAVQIIKQIRDNQ
ncbi:hypothetical protein RclHR1_11010003 [Rhizophagus clarus]|uniref:Uncharacterized protein n=1 Tax=Rhizophagus clarus TaxID=94130 RepID=A0A2Z6Q362_9GLOM|nr:hypothetical protein RclHR1_11010003 [Rhizophagus clarus]